MIGNAAYPDGEAPLAQPLNDARTMAGELRARGFDVELGEPCYMATKVSRSDPIQ